ncbi:hypothetical protein GCM10023114_17240 [Mycolicibacterium sediminis]|uniref:Uncharacterized protein n=1 Tax=Mycolicibacterium sediminis TaxID=1286180 RepID=A0A7I7QS06_9MYCO|nr:hypothetical protein MSEDJ_28430 [Mycolicibacterium sediminis]
MLADRFAVTVAVDVLHDLVRGQVAGFGNAVVVVNAVIVENPADSAAHRRGPDTWSG